MVIIIRVGALRFKPIPQPLEHDEFSYILGAETFAKGRLANPPHPLAPFFETMHVNMTPTYASKYLPGQAGIMALGIRLFGHPWYGVLLSVALMCAAICWALQGWVPGRWALMGGVLAALEFALLHRWIESYWGGAVAATGGALVIGALPRLARAGKVSTACFGALGVAILLNSRPFEGLLVILPCAGALLWWTRIGPRPWLRRQVILPALAILVANGAWLGFYNYRVTGSALTLPYAIYQTRNAPTPLFWILPATPAKVEYRDEAMARLWEWDSGFYWSARHNPLVVPTRIIRACRELVDGGAGFFVLAFALLSIVAARLRRWRRVLCLGALFLAGMMCERHALSHYLAPALAFVFIFASYGARLLYTARIGNKAIGREWVACIGAMVLASCVAWIPLLRAAAAPETYTPLTFKSQTESQLAAIPGQHVVLVRYAPTHDFHLELVYNKPDIDSQKVVWACDLGKERNRQLVAYYKGRTIWLGQPDPPNPTLTPYVE